MTIPPSPPTGDDAKRPVEARPDPLDRLWRHPSELPGRGRAHRSERTHVSLGVLLSIGFGSALFGSVLTVAILGLSGLLSGDPSPTVSDRLLTTKNDDARFAAAKGVRPSIVSIIVHEGLTTRHGAGICVRHDGRILTSSEIIGTSKIIDVQNSAGDVFQATVVGRDVVSGLALLQIDTDLPAASLAKTAPTDSQSVIVLGDNTIGEGIVNQTDALAANASGLSIPNAIITSARPPNTPPGSALVDRSGKIAGMFLPGDAGAVPIDYVRQAMAAIEAPFGVQHAWTGFTAAETTQGPVVSEVALSGPATVAGMKVGDVVLRVDAARVATMAQLSARTQSRWAGDTMTILVQRLGIEVELTLKAIADPTLETASTAQDPSAKGPTTTG